MSFKSYLGISCFLTTIIVPAIGFAADAQRAGLAVESTIWVDIKQDENSTRVDPNMGDEEIRETQNFYGLDFKSSFEGRSAVFDANYSAVQEEYTRDSQDNELAVRGTSSFSFGNEQSYYDVEASHEASRVLNNPDDEEINSNISQQSIFDLRAGIKSRGDLRQNIKLSGFFRDTRYEGSVEREGNTSSGIELSLVRRSKFFDRVGITALDSKVKYEDDDELDFDYSQYFAFVESGSRLVRYFIKAGVNRINPKFGGGASNDELYNAAIYFDDKTSNKVTFEYGTLLSSVSLLKGVNADGITVAGDGNNEDRVKVKSYLFGWTNYQLCQKCGLSFNFERQSLTYLNDSTSNQETQSFVGIFDYQISRKTSAKLSYNLRETEFISDSARASSVGRIELRIIKRQSEKLYFEAYIQEQEQDNPSSIFDARRYGFRAGLRFL